MKDELLASEPKKWISSATALRFVDLKTGSSARSQRLLDQAAAKGTFRARAKKKVIEYEAGRIKREPPSKEDQGFISTFIPSKGQLTVELPASFWTTKTLSAFEARHWQWRYGIFAKCSKADAVLSWVDGKPSVPARRRTIYYDVEFEEASIFQFATKIAVTKKVRKKRTESKYSWEGSPAYNDLLDRIKSGGSLEFRDNKFEIVNIDFSKPPGNRKQAALGRYIANQIMAQTEQFVSRETGRNRAREIEDLWRMYLSKGSFT